MFRKAPWNQGDGRGTAGTVKPGLPDDRKALVERYMIDAGEAALRERQAAADEQARREAGEARARREADEDRARREAAEEHARRGAAEQLARQAVLESEARRREAEERGREAAMTPAQLPEVVLHERTGPPATPAAEERPATADSAPEIELAEAGEPQVVEEFPIYVWLRRADPSPGDTGDWPRSLVRAKEEARRGETLPG